MLHFFRDTFENLLYRKSRLGIPQKLTQLRPRSHPVLLVGKRAAQKTPSKTPPATARLTAVSHTAVHLYLGPFAIIERIREPEMIIRLPVITLPAAG